MAMRTNPLLRSGTFTSSVGLQTIAASPPLTLPVTRFNPKLGLVSPPNNVRIGWYSPRRAPALTALLLAVGQAYSLATDCGDQGPVTLLSATTTSAGIATELLRLGQSRISQSQSRHMLLTAIQKAAGH